MAELLGITVLLVGFVLSLIVVVISRVILVASRTPRDEINQAIRNGFAASYYVNHGMVFDEKTGQVRPTSTLSRTFLDSLH